MPRISTVLTSILVTVIAGLILIYVQGPISRSLDPDRLEAEMHAGPWFPKLEENGEGHFFYDKEKFGAYEWEKITSGEGIKSAKIVIRNLGSKHVTDAKILFGQFQPDRVLIFQAGLEKKVLEKPNQIEFKSIAPGESFTVVLWSIHNLASPYLVDDWQTVSSQGPMKFSLHSYQENMFEESFIDKWIEPAAMIFWGLTWLFFLIIAALLDQYIKAVLKDEDYYLQEKLRFDEDPKKFSPKEKEDST